MGSVNDNIQAALSPIYGAKSTNHLIKLFRTDHGLLENDRWQAYLQGTPLSDITGLSPVGSLQDIERLLFENFAELHNESTGLYLPGTSGNYISTPDHADLDITGDLCLISEFTLVDWPLGPSSYIWIFAKGAGAGTASPYGLYINTVETLVFYISENGSTARNFNSSIAFTSTLVIGGRYKFAVTYDKDNGSSQKVCYFWYSVYPYTEWLFIDSATLSGTADLYVSTGILNHHYSGGSSYSNVIAHSAQVYDGIGDNSAPGLGTLVAEFDASAPVGPRYRDRTGKIWTINGSAWSWE